MTASPSGSSPRGRGTCLPFARSARFLRFIPARAGNMLCDRRARSVSPVHPRAGGEHRSRGSATVSPAGSSPRGRGTCGAGIDYGLVVRFIPARAGNMWPWAGIAPGQTVHPRAGGEHHCISDEESRYYGSSPRGRGTCIARAVLGGARRFIPARAGNIGSRARGARPSSVHPRAGGEHRSSIQRGYYSPGSSPRGRGTCRDPGAETVDLAGSSPRGRGT